MRTLDKSVKMCRDEGELLGNLVYRGRNQYRAFGWWQKVVGVYRQQKALVRMLNSRESSGKEEGEKKASNVPNGAQIHKCLAQVSSESGGPQQIASAALIPCVHFYRSTKQQSTRLICK